MKELREQFRIGTLAQQLGVKRFVIRFWEKEFGIEASRSDGGQRFYQKQDFEQFKLIKELLYERGFTIAGAKKMLYEQTSTFGQYHIKKRSPKHSSGDINVAHKKNFKQQLKLLQKQLIKLYNLLR